MYAEQLKQKMCELIENVWKICAWRASKMWDFSPKCVKLGRTVYTSKYKAQALSFLEVIFECQVVYSQACHAIIAHWI